MIALVQAETRLNYWIPVRRICHFAAVNIEDDGILARGLTVISTCRGSLGCGSLRCYWGLCCGWRGRRALCCEKRSDNQQGQPVECFLLLIHLSASFFSERTYADTMVLRLGARNLVVSVVFS